MKSEYTVKKNIGSGKSSRVFLVEKNNLTFILKKNIDNVEFLNEISILKKIKKGCSKYNVICFVKAHKGGILLENLEGIDMFDYYKKNIFLKGLKEITYLFIKQLANAIKFLHLNKIIHFDIKPENIIITEDKVLKLIDYGGSIVYKNKPITQNTYTSAYTDDTKKINLSFTEAKYKDWYSFFKTFRNDGKNILSPLSYTKDTILFKLFDTKSLNINNYKKRLTFIQQYILFFQTH